jgi:hypothetical protein
MRTFIVCVLMLGALALFSVPATVTAQKDKGKGAGGTIEISEGKDGKFRFTVRDAEGKFLANSGANNFATEKEARAGVEEFKAVVAKAKVSVAKKTDKDKKKDK